MTDKTSQSSRPWTIIFPGWAGIQMSRVEGIPCLTLVGGRRWWSLLMGGNSGRRLIERHCFPSYKVLVTGRVTWLWGKRKEHSQTFYEFLGVGSSATRAQILAAYQALPANLRDHPVTRYCRDTLADPTRRATYDAQLAEADRQLLRTELGRLAWVLVTVGAGMMISSQLLS